MTKHTPGPWRLSARDPFGDFTIHPPGEKLAIAAVVNGEMRRLAGEQAEHAANARLIAAAPEGFASLLDLHGFAKARIGEMDADELAQFERATAALAKAGVS